MDRPLAKHFLIFVAVILVAAGLGSAVGIFLAVMDSLPQVEELKAYHPSDGTRVYADDDQFVAEFNVEKGIFAPFETFPDHLKQAVVATEDRSFWTHSGVDVFAIGRAVVRDVMAGRMKEGGSTITQQLAKVLFLSSEKKLKRKLQELVLAFQIEKSLSKEEILELYLNKIYFGHGAYGIEMASRTYFGKSVPEVTLAEAAMLVGLIKAPNRYSPYNNMGRAQSRQKVVLSAMKEVGYVSEDEIQLALETPLLLRNTARRSHGDNYFLDALRKSLEEMYGTETLYKGGLKVYSTLNVSMQKQAEQSLQWGLRRFDKILGWRGPAGHEDPELALKRFGEPDKGRREIQPEEILSGIVTSVTADEARILIQGRNGRLRKADAEWAAVQYRGAGESQKVKRFSLEQILQKGDIVYVALKGQDAPEPELRLEQIPEIEGALVTIDPASGAVRALVGGYDFSRSEFNRAVSARRQPGSAFKPIIYTAAVESGFTPADMIYDEPIEYSHPETGLWQPGNYSRKNYGPTRLREALAYSRNIITVKLLEMIGIPKAVETARRMGFTGDLPQDLTLGLGSMSVTPLDLTSVYGVFATGGVRLPAAMIRYVLDAEDNLIATFTPEGQTVLEPETAFITTSMLEDVVRIGTGWRAKALKRPVAGKTGTTNDHRDAWFLGFTPDLVTGVWVGFDDMTTMGKKATGSSAAAPIWTRFMLEAIKEAPPREFSVPDGIVTAIIDPDTGLLATADTPGRIVEFFREGTVPDRYSTMDVRTDIMPLKEGSVAEGQDED